MSVLNAVWFGCNDFMCLLFVGAMLFNISVRRSVLFWLGGYLALQVVFDILWSCGVASNTSYIWSGVSFIMIILLCVLTYNWVIGLRIILLRVQYLFA